MTSPVFPMEYLYRHQTSLSGLVLCKLWIFTIDTRIVSVLYFGNVGIASLCKSHWELTACLIWIQVYQDNSVFVVVPETPYALGLYAIPEIILFSLAIPGDFNT